MKGIINFVRRRRADRELDQEFEAHLEEKVADLMDSGMLEREARQRARREFGNVCVHSEISRDIWKWVWLETLLQDLRYGARVLRKNPGFASVAVATLALRIAVKTTIFSVVSGWMLKKPSVADPDGVVMVVSTHAAPAVDFLAWRNANHVFDSMAAADAYHDFSLTGAGEPERLSGMRVYRELLLDAGGIRISGAYIPARRRPARARACGCADLRPLAAAVWIRSARHWKDSGSRWRETALPLRRGQYRCSGPSRSAPQRSAPQTRG